MKLKAALLVVGLFAANAAADYTEELSWSLELSDGGRISLENVNGNVEIIGGAGTQVEIVAVKKAGSEEHLEQIEVLVDHEPDNIRIEARHPEHGLRSLFGWGKDLSGSVHFTLHVPAGANLDAIESVNGIVAISGITGTIRADTVNGQVEVTGIRSDAALETVNGSVNATFARLQGAQKATCESVNGRVTVNLPADADATVSAETINGGIDGGDFDLEVNKGFVGRELAGRIGNGSARLGLSTVNGSIRIRRN